MVIEHFNISIPRKDEDSSNQPSSQQGGKRRLFEQACFTGGRVAGLSLSGSKLVYDRTTNNPKT